MCYTYRSLSPPLSWVSYTAAPLRNIFWSQNNKQEETYQAWLHLGFEIRHQSLLIMLEQSPLTCLQNIDSALDFSYFRLFFEVIKHITVFLHITVCSFHYHCDTYIRETRASCHTLLQWIFLRVYLFFKVNVCADILKPWLQKAFWTLPPLLPRKLNTYWPCRASCHLAVVMQLLFFFFPF